MPDNLPHAPHLDRELNELLQELRVIQGGILLLVGFELVVVFSSGFADATRFQKIDYFLTLLVTGTAAIVVVAPVVHHRMAFRRRDKERVVVRGNACILVAILLVALSMLGIATLVTNYLWGTTLTIVVAALYVACVSLLWGVLPLHSLRVAARENGA
ncbi:DUF6328 family protein [Nocardioides montaniterrae]